MFITTVIAATVIFVTLKGTSNISECCKEQFSVRIYLMVLPAYAGKVDFIRDSVALVVVISAVVTVAFDGVVGYGLQVYFSFVHNTFTLFLTHIIAVFFLA